MATALKLGHAIRGQYWQSMSLNRKFWYPVKPDIAVTVQSVKALLDGGGAGSGTQVLKAYIYADSAGAAGNLLATSNEVTVTKSDAAAWLTFTFGTPYDMSADTPYWLALHSGATADVARLGTQDGSYATSKTSTTDTYSDGSASPCEAGSDQAEGYAFYAYCTTSSLVFGNVGYGVDEILIDFAVDTMRMFKTTVDESGTVSKVSAYIDGGGAGSSGQVAKVVIYDDDGVSGKPGTLLATSSEVSVSDGQAAGWVDFTVSLEVTAGSYWVGIHGGTTSNNIRIHHGPGGMGNGTPEAYLVASDAYAGGAADPCAALTDSNRYLFMYATYTTGPAAPTLTASQVASDIVVSWT